MPVCRIWISNKPIWKTWGTSRSNNFRSGCYTNCYWYDCGYLPQKREWEKEAGIGSGEKGESYAQCDPSTLQQRAAAQLQRLSEATKELQSIQHNVNSFFMIRVHNLFLYFGIMVAIFVVHFLQVSHICCMFLLPYQEASCRK